MTNLVAAEDLLDAGLDELPFTISAEQREQLLAYLALLGKWNQVHNLTSVRDPVEQVKVHLLDCLAIVPFVKEAKQLADIGTGAGLPGLVLAVCLPNCHFYLVESNSKKCAFLRIAITFLKLKNVEVISDRVEKWQAPIAFDIVISRAVSTIDVFLNLTKHLGNSDTRWMLMKAHNDEICSVSGFAICDVFSVKVPYLGAPRLLINISKIV